MLESCCLITPYIDNVGLETELFSRQWELVVFVSFFSTHPVIFLLLHMHILSLPPYPLMLAYILRTCIWSSSESHLLGTSWRINCYLSDRKQNAQYPGNVCAWLTHLFISDFLGYFKNWERLFILLKKANIRYFAFKTIITFLILSYFCAY